MGKNQHSKDRLYVTATEWSTLYGGKKKDNPNAGKKYKKLPFDCCSLSLQPAEHPVCTRDGYIFDLTNIVPFIKKFHIHPVTGEPLALKDLVKLHFHRNNEGKYHCPVALKVFTDSTKITAVATTGNVYAHESIQNFNIKCKSMTDLMTGEPFTHKDLIVLQDPTQPEKKNFANFYYMKKGLRVKEPSSSSSSSSTIRVSSSDTKAIMDEVAKSSMLQTQKKYSSQLSSEAKQAPKDKEHAAHFSTGEVSASFTSTHLNVRTSNTAAAIDEDVVRYSKIKEKGYIRMRTNYGELNIELHCDIAPVTCENFILHAKAGYYNSTIFHRNIRNFVIQGGDPTGTGKGGASAFEGGKPFKDEFSPRLSHDSRGILSMANSGPNTNKSQFFITYRACKELDKKHSVFGKVVGGMETLMVMERIQTDKKDRPTKEIKIFDVQVFKDPFAELIVREAKEKEEDATRKAEEAAKKEKQLKVVRKGVGKYISLPGSSSPSSSMGAKSSSQRGDVAPGSLSDLSARLASTSSPSPLTSSVATSASAKRSSTVAQSSSSSSPSSLMAGSSTARKKAKPGKSGGFGDFSSW